MFTRLIGSSFKVKMFKKIYPLSIVNINICVRNINHLCTRYHNMYVYIYLFTYIHK